MGTIHMKALKSICFVSLPCCMVLLINSCGKKDTALPAPDPYVIPPAAFDINSIKDTYDDVASFSFYQKWGPYNVHDPSIKKFDGFYYSYSTDVAYGTDVKPGIQVRKSKDLVEWNFVGWAFNSLPVEASQFIQSKGGTPFNSIWAPYIMKWGSQHRLYYSLSSSTPRLSAIGLATASSPEGPWKESGLVVTSQNDNTIQTNAIDPSVIVTPSGEHWMYYGSAWDGIYVLKLDPATGLAAAGQGKGVRIANRGFTAGNYNGNIEAPEVVYNASLNKYFLFISYDWLETKYNVRVAKGDKPDGPFYDYNGRDVNSNEDHGPMILAPYQFAGHSGWQGTAHCAVFDDNGQYFMAHQGRPGINKFYMNMHVRKMYWTPDGWPVVSPERYAALPLTAVSQSELTGDWEQVNLNYRVVPGYQNEQTSPDFQVATSLALNANGTINNDAGSSWTFTAPLLQIKWLNGNTDKLIVDRERDWENKKNTIIFTGLNNSGIAVWGKKK